MIEEPKANLEAGCVERQIFNEMTDTDKKIYDLEHQINLNEDNLKRSLNQEKDKNQINRKNVQENYNKEMQSITAKYMTIFKHLENQYNIETKNLQQLIDPVAKELDRLRADLDSLSQEIENIKRNTQPYEGLTFVLYIGQIFIGRRRSRKN